MIQFQCAACGRYFVGRPGASCPWCPATPTPASHIVAGVVAWVTVLFLFVAVYVGAHNHRYEDCYIQPPLTAWPTQCL